MMRRKSTLIRHSLTGGPRTVAELVAETGLPYRDVERRLMRLRDKGRLLRHVHADGRPRGYTLRP